MGKLVFVTNIPVRGCVDGWVEVPDDTGPEDLNGAIGLALREKGWKPGSPPKAEDFELDLGLSLDWEFCTTREER